MQNSFRVRFMKITLALLVLSLIYPLVVQAESKRESTIELTPFASYRFGGDFDELDNNTRIDLDEGAGLGLITAWEYDLNRQGEFLISHYETQFDSDSAGLEDINGTDVSITYAHLGGNISFSQGNMPFWFSGGMGITHLSPNRNQLSDETNFSASLGINTKIALNKVAHIYIGGRVYGTFFDSESEIFCDSNDCAIFVEGDIWVQSELMAGISLNF